MAPGIGGILERASRIAIARALLDLLDGKTTTRAETAVELDAARYVDPERFAHERRRLFLEFPQVVGLSCDLPDPGSWSCEIGRASCRERVYDDV